MDPYVSGACPDDDPSRARLVLWRFGQIQEFPLRPHAMRPSGGSCLGVLGCDWILWALGPDTNWFLGGSTHWTWGGGWLSSKFGAFDFAGGIVVHTTVGVSPLVIAIMRLSAETYSTPFASANSGC